MEDKILNFINRYETHALLTIAVLTIFYYFFPTVWLYPVLIFIFSTVTAAFNFQGNLAVKKMRDQVFAVRVFAYFYGIGSAVLTLGILFKLMHFPGAGLISQVGMAGLLAACLAIFYTPIQDAYLPVLKKVLLRLAVLISLGLLVSM